MGWDLLGGKSSGELPQVDLVGAGGVWAHGAQPAGYPQRGQTAGRGGPDGQNTVLVVMPVSVPGATDTVGGCVGGVTG